MPFTRRGPNDYTSPSGRHFTGKQVKLYYATDGFKDMGKARISHMKAHVTGKGKRKKKPIKDMD